MADCTITDTRHLAQRPIAEGGAVFTPWKLCNIATEHSRTCTHHEHSSEETCNSPLNEHGRQSPSTTLPSSFQSQGCYEGQWGSLVSLFSQRQDQLSAQRVSCWMRHKGVPKQPSKLLRSRLSKHIGQSWSAEESESGISLPAPITELSGWLHVRDAREEAAHSVVNVPQVHCSETCVLQSRFATLSSRKSCTRVFLAGPSLAVYCVWRRTHCRHGQTDSGAQSETKTTSTMKWLGGRVEQARGRFFFFCKCSQDCIAVVRTYAGRSLRSLTRRPIRSLNLFANHSSKSNHPRSWTLNTSPPSLVGIRGSTWSDRGKQASAAGIWRLQWQLPYPIPSPKLQT